MLVCFGWAELLSSIAPFDAAYDDTADKELWSAFRVWMNDRYPVWRSGGLFRRSLVSNWTLTEQANHVRGLLQFYDSTNHRNTHLFEMMDWICENGPGSYGLFYVHDDEDVRPSPAAPNESDHRNEFRVHRICQGQVTELADPFLSPIVPTINPSWSSK